MPTSVVLAGRYRLVDLVARGGAGHVWRGVDDTLGRDVAVKVVDMTGSPDLAAAARFERELRTTANLAHPNVVTVYDGGFEGDRAYLVMELLSGPSLAELVATRGPLPVGAALDYAGQVCAGLAVAHDAGVVHRDLKPANLVLSVGGAVKIVDFGIARLLAAPGTTTATDLTSTGTVLGTTAYLAPEQACGGWVDGRADLYALGCVLFFVLTGAPPYDGDNPMEIAAQHVHAPVPSLVARRPDVPMALDLAVRDLLAKDPDRRPQHAADASARLRAVGPAVGPAATVPPVGPVSPVPSVPSSPAGAQTVPLAVGPRTVHTPMRTEAPPGRPRGLVWAAVAVIALLAAALAFAFADGGNGPRRAAAAPPTRTVPTTSSTSVPTTTATTAPTTTQPLTAVQATSQLATVVQQVSASGDLAAGATRDLMMQVSNLQHAVADGKPGPVGHMVADFANHLDALVNQGQLTPAGRAAFSAPLAALERLYPSGPPGGRDKGDGG